MKDLLEWARGFDVNQKPWLLLGKGPSFDRIGEVDLDRYFTCSMNHVVRELPVTLAHIADIDVVHDCAASLYRNARWVVMPYFPHLPSGAGERPLPEYVGEIPVLSALEREGRLVWYNLATGLRIMGDSPVVQISGFSGSAALGLLVECGVTTVRSLGIEGGTDYARRFDDLAGVTRLRGGVASFDVQWPGFVDILRTRKVLYGPLLVDTPARVFVGAAAAERLPARVLEYTIRKHARMSVDVVTIDNGAIPEPRDPANRSRTNFSLARFRIPELCGEAGRGIYLDSDMLVFTDIGRLWTHPMDGVDLLYVAQHRSAGARRRQA